MNLAEKNTNEIYPPEFKVEKNRSVGQKIFSSLLSLVPWSIVAALLWAGIFVKPLATVEVVVPPAIDKRDNIFGISSLNSDLLWFVGNYGKILRSTNGGQNWERQDSPVRNHLQDISAWNEHTAIAVGNGGVVIVTEDGGSTWQEVQVPKSEVSNKLIRVHCYKDGEAWAVGEMGMILHSNDYGNTWDRMREEEDVIMNDVIRTESGTVFVVGEYGRLFRSDDDGETWQEPQMESPSSLMAIDFRDAENGVIVGLDGVILTTIDGGETWNLIAGEGYGNTEHLMDVQWSEQTNTWVAVGNKGRWVRFSDDMKNFHVDTLSGSDLASHTELTIVNDGIVTVGATSGRFVYETGKFTILGQ